MYTYKKRLNNNVVVALDEQGQEQILTGRGIGFQVEAGTPVDDQKIEKVFKGYHSKQTLTGAVSNHTCGACGNRRRNYILCENSH